VDVTDADLLGGLARLVESVSGVPAAQVRPAHRFVDDLRVDSLAMVELLEACRVHLGVAVGDEATGQLVHVGDLLDYLRVHLR
jgi:acyl carrier protein